jgi:hypothetical protein
MRASVLAFVGAFGLAVSFQTAAAVPLVSSSGAAKPVIQSVPVASHNCGKGQRWVPAGYAKHGKYRVGHCAPA